MATFGDLVTVAGENSTNQIAEMSLILSKSTEWSVSAYNTPHELTILKSTNLYLPDDSYIHGFSLQLRNKFIGKLGFFLVLKLL